eukprot:Skav218796  [mRNA]  locus=scaffold1140:183205:186833:- [translate_table: standard]
MSLSPSKSPLAAHSLKKKVFLVPTWCSNCKGVLVGSGFECTGPCRMRCHIGLGANKAEHCKAELLLKPCEECEESSRVHGKYKFGDMTKQIFRNEHQRIKDMVVQEALKEQRSFGKFDKLKSYAEDIQSKWDAQMVKQYLLYAVLLSNFAIFMLIYCFVLLIAWPAHGYSRAQSLGWFQAVSNFASLTIFEGVLAVALHLLLHQCSFTRNCCMGSYVKFFKSICASYRLMCKQHHQPFQKLRSMLCKSLRAWGSFPFPCGSGLWLLSEKASTRSPTMGLRCQSRSITVVASGAFPGHSKMFADFLSQR